MAAHFLDLDLVFLDKESEVKEDGSTPEAEATLDPLCLLPKEYSCLDFFFPLYITSVRFKVDSIFVIGLQAQFLKLSMKESFSFNFHGIIFLSFHSHTSLFQLP